MVQWIRIVPDYKKLTLHEIKVLKINATQIYANLMKNDFQIKETEAKEEVTIQNEGN